MKRLQTLFAYFLAGFLVPTVWHYLAAPFGYFAGFIATVVVIAPVWYLVYYQGLIEQDEQAPVLNIGGDIGKPSWSEML